MVPELAIQVEEPVEVCVQKLVARVYEVKEEMAMVLLKLNLQIDELQLKAQPSTLPEVKEQHTSTITTTIAKVNSATTDYTNLFEESFEVISTLQEDSNIQHLETEAHELQNKYDEVKENVQMVSLTQRLAQMQQAKALKE